MIHRWYFLHSVKLIDVHDNCIYMCVVVGVTLVNAATSPIVTRTLFATDPTDSRRSGGFASGVMLSDTAAQPARIPSLALDEAEALAATGRNMAGVLGNSIEETKQIRIAEEAVLRRIQVQSLALSFLFSYTSLKCVSFICV